MRIERNFLLSPMSMQLDICGSSAFTASSIGTGATFSPPAVMSSSAIYMSMPSICMRGGNNAQEKTSLTFDSASNEEEAVLIDAANVS